ncbi:signal peptidase I [Vagococcus sp. JNUCC 83]
MTKPTWIKDLIWYVVLIIALVLLRVFVFTPVTVSGESMMPTLVDGERNIALKMGDTKRFDIVSLVAPDDPSKNYVKRVIGMPGDTVEYKDDVLYINGKKMDEPYLAEKKAELKQTNPDDLLTPDFSLESLTGEKTVPENSYFVMGDNRQNSKDSRFPEVGFIPKENIIGKSKIAFWPPSKWGMVK